MEFARPERISHDHWNAVSLHARRVEGQHPSDHGGLIGACKDLVECVARIVLAEATSPEIDDFPKLVRKACTLLGATAPKTDGSDAAATLAKGLGMIVGAHETAAQGLGELRNGHGSGHGRASMPVLAPEDLALVPTYTEAWVRWALARLERLLVNSVSALITDLTGTTFYSGVLRQRLIDLDFENLGVEEQERLGFAIAERGARGGTFVVAGDGIAPLIDNDSWPKSYQYGVVQGLLLTPHGTLDPVMSNVIEAVLPRLGTELIERLLDEVQAAPLPPL
jgi:hypothetical protein